MSFERIIFNYTPPPTVSSPIGIGTNTEESVSLAASPPTLRGAAYQNSNAGKLVQRLQGLSATAKYLQSAVASISGTIGVSVDPSIDADLSRALQRIYNTPDAVPAISMAMYQNLLQAQTDITKVDLGLDPNSTLQISPTQRMDINLATDSFEKALAGSGSYASTVPLLLAQSAGDGIIFDNLTAQLQDYPVLRNNNPSGVDVSDSLTATMNDVADRYTSTYATTYSMLATPDPVAISLPSVVTTLSQHSTNQLGNILYLLTSLISLFHKPQQVGLGNSLNGVIFPRLITDMSGNMFLVDRFTQMACNPNALLNTGIGTIMGKVPKPFGALIGAGLTSLFIQSELSAQQQALNQQLRSKTAQPNPGINALPAGLVTMAATLNFSLEQNQLHATAIQTNTSKAMDRRLNESGDTIEVMSSLKSIETMVGTVQSMLNTRSSGAQVAMPTGLASNLQVVGQVVGNLKTNTGTAYTVQGNNLVLTPPAIPQPSLPVASVLQQGGATIVASNSLITVPIGA